LVANEWIALAAIDPATGEAYSLGTDMQWRGWLGDYTERTDDAINVMTGEA
jgi:hypothetical protein